MVISTYNGTEYIDIDSLEPKLINLLKLIKEYRAVDQRSKALKPYTEAYNEAAKRYSEQVSQLHQTQEKYKKLEHLLKVVKANKPMIVSQRRLEDGNYEVITRDPLEL